MPFQRPTLAQLISQSLSIFAAKLPGADVTLKAGNISVSARVMAALINGNYGYLDYLAQQILPTTQDWFFLTRFGGLFNLVPDPGAEASGNALFSGTTGVNVPSGSKLQDSLGNLYTTTATVALGVGTTSIPMVAEEVGSDQNLDPTAPLTLTTAISGVNAVANVDSAGLTGGRDPDSADNPNLYRARVLARLQNPPGGVGNAADYTRWGQSAGVGATRFGIFPLARGSGTADIRFVIDGRSNIVPSAPEIAAVQAAIDANKPITDTGVVVQTVTAQPVNYTLSAAAFSSSDQANIADALAALHAGIGVGAGLSLQADIVPAVTSVAKPAGSFLTAPAADIAPDPTKVLTLGSLIFS